MAADGTSMSLVGVGSIVTSCLSFIDVYILILTLNLVFVSQLCKSGYLVSFSLSNCYLQDPRSQKLIRTGHRQGGLYVLDQHKVPDVAASSVDLSSIFVRVVHLLIFICDILVSCFSVSFTVFSLYRSIRTFKKL